MASLRSVLPGDIVLAEVKGRRAYALVSEKHGREIDILPINDRTFTWRTVTGRQVIGHWRKSRTFAQAAEAVLDQQFGRKTTINGG